MASLSSLPPGYLAHGHGTRVETLFIGRGPIAMHVSQPSLRAVERVVIVLHGRERDAAKYCGQWGRAIADRPIQALVPEFDSVRFPGWRGYNLAGMLNLADRPTPPETWLFETLDEIRTFAHARHPGAVVDLFGHSAGAQLLMRYALFSQAPVDATEMIAANAGWYTAPSLDAVFPYGVNGAPREVDLVSALSRRLTLLIGAKDTDRAHHALRRDRGADAQGLSRLSRAEYCIAMAEARARELSVPTQWRLRVLAGAGHSNAAMAVGALNWIERRAR